jgi:hypothetical protein
MDGATIKQIGIASVLRSMFKGTNKHHIYKDLSNIVHSPDKIPERSNIYSDFTLSYNQDIDDKLYNYNKLLNDSERIGDIWFAQRTIDNYNRTSYNPMTYSSYHIPYVSAHRFTITPSNFKSRSPTRFSRSPLKKKRKRSRSSSRKY